MSELLEEVRGPLAGCRADKEVWDEIERLEAKIEKLESIISRAHAEIEMLIEGIKLRRGVTYD